MTKPCIVGLGEVLWDVLPEGPKFGGAPANFACSAAELAGESAEVEMVSGVGLDALGPPVIAALGAHHVGAEHVSASSFQTSRVDVKLDAAGIASYVFAENVAWDHLEWSSALAALAAKTDVVCFGTLSQRSPVSSETIQRFARSTRRPALRVFDINLRSPFWSEKIVLESLKLANIFKLNDAELPILSSMLNLHGSDIDQLRQINQLFSLKLTALTRGSSGSLLVSADGETSDLPAEPTTVVDTVGAGDAYTAAMVMGLIRKLPLKTINKWASRVAAYVCSQPGATPHLPESLKHPENLGCVQ
jgi:fructokinase